MSSVVRIDNLNKILSGLRKVGVEGQDLKAATAKVASLVLPQAKALTPVRKGRLLKTVKANKAQNSVILSAGTSTSVPYGAVIHWGWAKHNIEPNKFFIKVRNANEEKVREIYVTELQRLIDQTMDGIK